MQTEVKPRPELEVYSEMPPVARELQLTRDFLASHRWGRNAYFFRGRYCVLGAHEAVINPGRSEGDPVRGFSYRAANYWLQATNLSPSRFNDFVAKSKKDVLAALDQAVSLALAAGE